MAFVQARDDSGQGSGLRATGMESCDGVRESFSRNGCDRRRVDGAANFWIRQPGDG